jgi:Arabinose-binding domain of AraC transcription regulator, N-term
VFIRRATTKASEHIAHYKKLTAPEEILIQLNSEEFSVGFRWLHAVNAEPQILTDYCFAWMLSLARHGTGKQLTPLRVEYVPQPANQRTIERNLGCKGIGGASRNAIIFRASDPWRTGQR